MSRGLAVNGAAIRAIRERMGFSGVDFAKRIGIDRAYLSNVELGHRARVSPAVAQRITEALGVPFAAISSGACEPDEQSERAS